MTIAMKEGILYNAIMLKREDFRKLSISAQASMRKIALKLVKRGESQLSVAELIGVSRQTAGLVGNLAKNLTFTVDAYFIHIDNRIVLSSQFNRSNPLVATILNANGVDPTINALQFWTNAINTDTRGIDVVLTQRHQLHVFVRISPAIVVDEMARIIFKILFAPIQVIGKNQHLTIGLMLQ